MSIGRGLGALIASTGTRKKTTYATGDNQSPQRLWSVPTSEISSNPKQPRRNFKPEELRELAESIKLHGILQPILVAEKTDGGYEIIAGERRWRAAQAAGLPVVPVIVKDMAEGQKLEVSLIENIQREDLNPIEEAFAYKRLIEEFGLTQQLVAEKVGKSRPVIANTIRLLELPEEAQSALIAGKINSGQARALLSVTDKKQQIDILTSMLGEKITVRELERQVQKNNSNRQSSRRDPNLLYLEEKLRGALGAKVTITQKGERGTICVNYFSKKELAELVAKIGG